MEETHYTQQVSVHIYFVEWNIHMSFAEVEAMTWHHQFFVVYPIFKQMELETQDSVESTRKSG